MSTLPLHTLSTKISNLLTNYSKLAQQTSTTYSSSGLLLEDLGRKKGEMEEEIKANLDEVRFKFLVFGLEGAEG